MMDREQGYGSGAVQVAHGSTYAETHLEGMSGRGNAPGAARALAHVFGTLLSLAVICTGAYWGYKQMMRDVHGVPVVRALEGPMRVAPEDPGGQVADNEGLSVNAVQAIGTASEPEARLTLAPAPVDLSEEDQPTRALREAAVPEGGVLTNAAEADDSEIVADSVAPLPASLSQERPLDDAIARAVAMAAASTAGATPLTGTETLPEAPAEQVEPVKPSIPQSPRPMARPVRIASTLPAATPVVARPAVVDPADVPVGTRLVQFGAYDSAADAETSWNRIVGQFDGLMADKSRVIVEAKAGGRTFWRLRAMGFEDLADARRFCAAMVAERTDCIPVIAR